MKVIEKEVVEVKNKKQASSVTLDDNNVSG